MTKSVISQTFLYLQQQHLLSIKFVTIILDKYLTITLLEGNTITFGYYYDDFIKKNLRYAIKTRL